MRSVIALAESRYDRQEILPHIGKEGQAVLAKARVSIIGLGALGSVSSDILARSGVGYLRLIDSDQVELTNLQRVSLYNEDDVLAAAPKAVAAKQHLAAINSTITIDEQVVQAEAHTICELIEDVDLVLDGSDNLQLRYLLNEAAHKLAKPWIYTGVTEAVGMILPITEAGPCFQCLTPLLPESDARTSRVTAGILPSTTRLAATLQATLALKMLLGKDINDASAARSNTATLLYLDAWSQELERIVVEKDPDCPVCGKA